jgi:hypothetical protein
LILVALLVALLAEGDGVEAGELRSDYREESSLLVLNEGNFYTAVNHDFRKILVFFREF